MTRGVICTPHLKKSYKNPNQKFVECCVKAPIRQVFFTGFPVYSAAWNKMLENTSMDIFYKKSAPNGCI